jgi:cytochrome b6
LRKPSNKPTLEAVRAALTAWFRTRLDLEPVIALLRRKPVPVHRHGWIYTLGDALVFLFALQASTGFLLAFYYQPTEAAAHESVSRIMSEVPFGWLVRSMHVWGASLLMAVVGLHLLTVLFAGAYRKPRELAWISGVLMLFVVMGAAFSGYLLPWNELSYYATRVGTQIPGKLPVVGPWLVHFLRGGEQLTGATITRFFAAHVMLAPTSLIFLLSIHVLLSRVRGVGLPIGTSARDVVDRRPFFSEFLLIDACVWLVLFGTVATLAVVWPAEIGVKADLLQPAPEGIKPEWYFLFMFQTLKQLPETVAILLFAVTAAFLLLLPFLERGTSEARRGRGWTAAFLLWLAYAAVFQILALLTPGPQHAHDPRPGPALEPANAFVSLGLLWSVIGFLLFYLRQLLRENRRIRMLYQPKGWSVLSQSERT